MKIAVVMTSIDVPHVLQLYRQLCPYVTFFIAGDEKADHGAMFDFTHSLGGAHYLSPDCQRERGYVCSELLGWNTLARRNIATLEALAHGADVLHFLDWDNYPIGVDLHRRFYLLQRWPGNAPELFHGMEARGSTSFNWFDPGQLISPPVMQRGFLDRDFSERWKVVPVTGAALGVLSGLVLGDPDIDAVERMVTNPHCMVASELADAGVVTDPRLTWTMFNSQNTAFVRELAPAMFMAPGLGRAVDIFASLITQRVMAEKNLYVHFGRPFVYQERSPHDPMVDLAAELMNMQHVGDLADYLSDLRFGKMGMTGEITMSVANMVQGIYIGLKSLTWYPRCACEAAEAWIDDCKRVLK